MAAKTSLRRTYPRRVGRTLGLCKPDSIGLSLDDRSIVMTKIDSLSRSVTAIAEQKLQPGWIVGGQILNAEATTWAVHQVRSSLKVPASAEVAVCIPEVATEEPSCYLRQLRSDNHNHGSNPNSRSSPEHEMAISEVLAGAGLHAVTIESLAVVVGRSVLAEEDLPTVVEVSVQVGWTEAIVTINQHGLEWAGCRSSTFADVPDIRYGNSGERPGEKIDPFIWEGPTRELSLQGIIAAGAALPYMDHS